jgi:hypothetical protein
MGLRTKLQDLDARGFSLLPLSTETSSEFLQRLAAANRGPYAPAVAALAGEVLQQRDKIEELERRLEELTRREQ